MKYLLPAFFALALVALAPSVLAENGTENNTTPLSASLAAASTYPQGLEMRWNCDASGGVSPYTYSFIFGDGTAKSASAENTAFHVYESNGTYNASCTVHDSGTNDTNQTVTVYSAITVSTQAPQPVNNTTELSVTLKPKTGYPIGLDMIWSCTAKNGTQPYTFDYVFGDGTVKTGSSSDSAFHHYESNGTYNASCTVHDSGTNGTNQTKIATANITVQSVAPGTNGSQNLSATLTADQGYPRNLEVVWRCDAKGGVKPYTYDFSFGDGTFKTSSYNYKAFHLYESNGTYNASCTVHDNAQNNTTAYASVTVKSELPRNETNHTDSEVGAKMRLLSLEFTIKRKVLHANAVIDALEKNSASADVISHLEDVRDDLSDLAVEADDAINSDNTPEENFAIFKDIKERAQDLVTEFRDTVKNDLTDEERAALRAEFKNIDFKELKHFRERRQEIRDQIKGLRKQFHDDRKEARENFKEQRKALQEEFKQLKRGHKGNSGRGGDDD